MTATQLPRSTRVMRVVLIVAIVAAVVTVGVALVVQASRHSDEQTYINQLGRIDLGLVVNRERALRRAEATCADMDAGLSGDALTQRVVDRLSGGDAQIDTADADRAIGLMRQYIC